MQTGAMLTTGIPTLDWSENNTDNNNPYSSIDTNNINKYSNNSVAN
jgi:hypothetical protein